MFILDIRIYVLVLWSLMKLRIWDGCCVHIGYTYIRTSFMEPHSLFMLKTSRSSTFYLKTECC